jgi:pyruvate formate lyase activating enzyme
MARCIPILRHCEQNDMEAFLYQRLKDARVRCDLCSHRCVIEDGCRGRCQVRQNRAGTLETRVFGQLIARSVDPIEKKPLYHLFPSSLSYSIATVGCNFRCRFCQNADIAQMPVDRDGLVIGDPASPDSVVAAALAHGCRSIAYTYTEPTVFFEFAYQTARLAHEKGLKNVFVTNGYMTAEALEMIGPYLDAANVDLKAFTQRFYQQQCQAKLAPVKETLKAMVAAGILVEVTTLLISGLNDNPSELGALARFLVDALGPDTPWHISRFHPAYRLTNRPPTAAASLERARQIGLQAGLTYVYTGNVPGDPGEKTFCPGCQAVLVDRRGFRVQENRIRDNRCPECGQTIYGLWQP